MNRTYLEAEDEGRVVASQGGFFDVQTPAGIFRCRLRGRFKQGKAKTDLCVVGDWVRIQRSIGGNSSSTHSTIEEVTPRKTRLSRRRPGKGGKWREDILVANIDRIFVVFCFGDPAFHPRMLDRFLVIAEHQKLQTIIVMNKGDLADEATRELFSPHKNAGYQVLETSVSTGQGMNSFFEATSTGISGLAGPSGVGKSSLINMLSPDLQRETNSVSDSHGKGKHTTRSAALLPLPSGGLIIDTPGIRELGIFNIERAHLAEYFVEFRPFLGQCGFGDCAHLDEPYCALKQAVDAGTIAKSRFDSYQRMMREDG
ncbi:MAG: ribosome small subunit-dependent GTPase A [Myxococcota bacterium]